MKTVSRRIARLEERFAPRTQDPVKRRLQFITSMAAGGVPDLSKCTAKRTLCPGGVLLESIRLNGSAKLLDAVAFEAWLQSIPVLTLEESRAAQRDEWRLESGDPQREARRHKILCATGGHTIDRIRVTCEDNPNYHALRATHTR